MKSDDIHRYNTKEKREAMKAELKRLDAEHKERQRLIREKLQQGGKQA